jgi:hypothetical protein
LSPLAQIKSLEIQLRGVVSRLDLPELPAKERDVVVALKNDLIDAKLDIRDFELSDTLVEQRKHGKHGMESLEKVRSGILAASEYNIFSAIDVAQFSAQLEQIIEEVNS